MHASGVSCLIANPQLQRVTEPEPPVIGVTTLSSDPEAAVQYNTKCLYMPQEQADADPDCEGVATFHGTNRRVEAM